MWHSAAQPAVARVSTVPLIGRSGSGLLQYEIQWA
jgi:hypothetical protein